MKTTAIILFGGVLALSAAPAFAQAARSDGSSTSGSASGSSSLESSGAAGAGAAGAGTSVRADANWCLSSAAGLSSTEQQRCAQQMNSASTEQERKNVQAAFMARGSATQSSGGGVSGSNAPSRPSPGAAGSAPSGPSSSDYGK